MDGVAQVISGLNKFDADLVSKVARAAAAGGGTHIDIACDPELVRVAKAVSNVPVSDFFLANAAGGAGRLQVLYVWTHGLFDFFSKSHPYPLLHPCARL